VAANAGRQLPDKAAVWYRVPNSQQQQKPHNGPENHDTAAVSLTPSCADIHFVEHVSSFFFFWQNVPRNEIVQVKIHMSMVSIHFCDAFVAIFHTSVILCIFITVSTVNEYQKIFGKESATGV
jgi:hypothetical protein